MLLTALTALLLADLQPIIYTVSFPDPQSHLARIQAFIPASKAPALDLFLPVWSPGFYHQEDYAAKVRDLTATLGDGSTPQVERTAPNRWRISTSYKSCPTRSARNCIWGCPQVLLAFRALGVPREPPGDAWNHQGTISLLPARSEGQACVVDPTRRSQ
jgi:hypothetical protein